MCQHLDPRVHEVCQHLDHILLVDNILIIREAVPVKLVNILILMCLHFVNITIGAQYLSRRAQGADILLAVKLTNMGVHLVVRAQANKTMKITACLTVAASVAAITTELTLFFLSDLPDNGV